MTTAVADTLERLADAGMRQTLRWQTDVLEAQDGTEQRVSLASLPRQSFEAAITATTEADLVALRSLLHVDGDQNVYLPQPQETVASVNAITGTTITIDPTYTDWNTAGQRVYVRRSDGTAYITAIDSVGGGGATLTVEDDPPAGTWAAGTTTITPVEPIYLEDGQPVARRQVKVGTWRLAGRATTARALTGTGGGSLTQHDSIDVLDRRPLADGPLAEASPFGVEFQDAGGAVAVSTSWTVAKERRELTFKIVGALQRQWWKKWLTNRRGRWVTFLCPTWRPDLLKVTMTAGAGSFTIDSTYSDYVGTWWPSLAHRRVQVEKSDGTVFYRTISNAVDSGGGIHTLTVSSALPNPLGTVTCVSFLELVRLDTDEVSIEWQKPGVLGRITFPIVVVQG